MPGTSKVDSLVDKISQVLNREIKKGPVNLKEFLSVLGTFVAFICDQLAANSSSLEEIDTHQKKVIAFFFQQYISPSFEERRRQLTLTCQEADHPKFSEPREELLNQINDILTRSSITADEGFMLLEGLTYLITCLCSQDVVSQEDIKEIGQKSLTHVKEGLALALDVIQAEKGLVTKH